MGLSCVGPLIHRLLKNKCSVSLPYLPGLCICRFIELWMENRVFHPRLGILACGGPALFVDRSVPFCIGDLSMRSWGSLGGPGTNPLPILTDDCSYVFRESKVRCGFLMAQWLAPLIPALFRGQLYIYPASCMEI